jgi:predicted nucleic acid-binding protein
MQWIGRGKIEAMYCDTISKSRSRYAVQIPIQLPEIPICRDLYGEPLLHLAIFVAADYLVTGDRDLLCLVGIFDPPIVTAEQFLNIFMS